MERGGWLSRVMESDERVARPLSPLLNLWEGTEQMSSDEVELLLEPIIILADLFYK